MKNLTAHGPHTASLRAWQLRIFWLLWAGYASYYLCRVNFAVAQPLILREFPTWTAAQIGLIPSIYAMCYAVGQVINGTLGERFGARRLMTVALVGAAVTNMLFSVSSSLAMLLVLWAVAIGLGWDRKFQAAVLRAFPGYGAGLTALEEAGPVREALERRAERGGPAPAARGDGRDTLGDWGPAPGLVAEGPWLNLVAPAPTMESLRGKVVIVDFWTYSCVNCVRTIPHLRRLYDTYRGRGLELIGVHTPEFAFERSTANVARAIADLGVTWPVVQDNDYAQWTAYANRYWPAHFIIDARGTLRASIFGEGREEETETVVRRLLTGEEVDPREARVDATVSLLSVTPPGRAIRPAG